MKYKYLKEVEGDIFPEPYKGYSFLFLLDDLLAKNKFTQRGMAKRIGIEDNHTLINKISNGNIKHLPISTLLALCVELDCTLDELFPIIKLEGDDDV